ncbi:MAG: PBP1A family penicillin-binding protein [Cyanophyceae cyanobacterium]
MTKPQTQLSRIVTQAVQTVQAKLNFDAVTLKEGAKVPELRLKDAQATEAKSYPLLGDRYLIGRSSRSCDIVVRNPIVSQIHCSVRRENQSRFVLKDENSTNGVFLGKRRLETFPLRHGDTITLGPPDLAAAVQMEYHNPPPRWVMGIRYALYGSGGLLGLLMLLIGIEWFKTPVRPLPVGETGPVVVYPRDSRTPLNPLNDEPHRELKRLSEFSDYLPKAAIASEDSRYYWHFGFDPIGILRAVVVNVLGREVREGGSTITQQLARSIFPEVGRENTLGRKLREIAVATKLEAVYSKDTLLTTYLNRVYLGVGNYGFEDAAQFYFEKSAADLTLSEAATLVAILPAPNSYNPVQNYDTALKLRNRVINRMVQLGMVSEAEAARARRSRIEVSPKAQQTFAEAIAPYFYTYVLTELQELLGQDLAKEGNFVVETSLDLAMQEQAETSLRQTVADSGDRFGFSQGALVTLTQTGEIRALVGGVDYAQSQFNRATQAQRQPGSTFKVFAYAAALEQGIPPGKAYSCAAFSWGGRSYRPCERSGGNIDMYTGLAQSENVVALRVAQEAGLNQVVKTARRFGIDSQLDAVPGVVIGQNEVNVLEMTGAYTAFANNGVWQRPHAITKIFDSSDCTNYDDLQTCRVIYTYEADANPEQVIAPTVAQTMNRMLRTAVQSGTGRRAYLGLEEAGKTGTTDKAIDLWFIGYLPEVQLVTGIWLGNDDNSPTQGSSSQAAALWGSYMEKIAN